MTAGITWDVTYMGAVIRGIREDRLKIPTPYNFEEAERLRALGYEVWQDLASNGTIIGRPR